MYVPRYTYIHRVYGGGTEYERSSKHTECSIEHADSSAD